MKLFLVSAMLGLASLADAKVEVMFHPKDPTLEQIAEWIDQAQSTVDIAMYNMETSDSSPVIQKLRSASVQQRIHSQQLQVRLVFEGYGTPTENTQKMAALESLGIDVRYLGKSVKVHHKFAVIDTGLRQHRVITGSANWSLSSYRNYNENILFFSDEAEVTARYQQEFNRLWKNAHEFGSSLEFEESKQMTYVDDENVEVYFNSPRFIDKDSLESSRLTSQVVRLIGGAQYSLKIATTRVRLVPALEALAAAAKRGVKVQIIISQDDYRDIGRRAKYLFSHPNIQLRVKFYNLKPSEYLKYQMHHKFMIVDDSIILSGSFNWSESSENRHIENLVELKGALAQEVWPQFNQEFVELWGLGRRNVEHLESDLVNMQQIQCAFSPMALNVSEIRCFLKLGADCQ
ncbi:MAG: phospholipase D-like domain-containing protein [Bdellovibrionia bacterium]